MSVTVSQDQSKATSGYYIPVASQSAEVIINKAIVDSSDVVILDEGTYKISSCIKVRKSITIKGINDKVIIVPVSGAVCNTSDVSSNGNITVYNTSDVRISNLKFNHPTCNGKTDGSAEGVGKGNLNEQRACIRVQGSSNVEIDSCTVKFPIYMDFCYVSASSYVNVHDNYADKTGHALVQFDSGSHDCSAYNNWHKVYCNAGIRSYGGKNIKIYNNTLLGGYNSGQALIELRGSIYNITITNNILYGCHFSTQNFVIQCDGGASASQVHCTDNVWWDAPGGFGQISSAGNIQASVDQQNEDYWLAKGYGAQRSNTAPVSDFDVTPESGTAPVEVETDNKSTGSNLLYNWDFGDGSKSSEKNPTHIYKDPGTYTVKLTVTNVAGSSSAQETITVNAPAITKIIVGFDGKQKYNCKGTRSNPTDAPIINAAIQDAYKQGIKVVELQGPHSYYINEEIFSEFTSVKLTGVKGSQIIWNFF